MSKNRPTPNPIINREIKIKTTTTTKKTLSEKQEGGNLKKKKKRSHTKDQE